MTRRFLVCIAAVAGLVAMPLAAQNNAAKAKAGGIPKGVDGHADLTGIWTNATITPLQRSARLKDKPTLSDAEAKKFEQAAAADLNKEDGASDGPIIAAAGSSGTGGYNVLFVDRGTEFARVDGVKRSSLIIDPPDGRDSTAHRCREGTQHANVPADAGEASDNIDDQPLSERCMIGFGSTCGTSHAAGPLQQQLPDRSNQGLRNDHDRDGA